MPNWILPGADVDTSTLNLAGWLDEGEEVAYPIGDVMGVNCPCHDHPAEAVLTISGTAKAACALRGSLRERT